MLNLLKNFPKRELFYLLTGPVSFYQNFSFFRVLSLKILNLLPSHPVLFCLKNTGKPSSITINNEAINNIGKVNNSIRIEKNLSIKNLKNNGIPVNRELLIE
jgi:hypothetical protein